MSSSSTVPCDCCKDDRECYEITGWSASPIGTPGCATTAELEIVLRYIEKPVGMSPTSDEVKSTIDGGFRVDCSMEPSGFCRNRGADGFYPWTAAVFESSTGADGASFSYNYLFEDCQLDDEDFKITINVKYLADGKCPGSAISW